MRRLIVFAKAPVAGAVKTRLIAQLGPEGAAALHRELVERTLATGREAAARSARAGRPMSIELCCAPDRDHPFFHAMAERHGCTLTEQGAGDLGARMDRALARGLAVGDMPVLVGTDCPVFSPNYLIDAFLLLEAGSAAVLGPAEDGGYVLIGIRVPIEGLFESIEWGGDGVLAATREKLVAAHKKHRELNMLWDLDRPADLARYREFIAQPSDHPDRTPRDSSRND